jgi:hypothetical protein
MEQGVINQSASLPPADPIIMSLSSLLLPAPDLRPAPSLLCNYKLIVERNLLLGPSSSTNRPFPPAATLLPPTSG